MTRYIRSLSMAASALAVLLLVRPAWPADHGSAGDGCRGAACAGCCAHCGRSADCCKVCRLVCKEKELKVNCWASECKPFCVPCPSCKGCKNVECVDCSRNCNCSMKKLVWFDWCPGDARVRTKKVLLKKEVKKKVPAYEWVIEDLCASCNADCQSDAVSAGTDLPPVPEEAMAGDVRLVPAPLLGAHTDLSAADE